MNWYHSFCFFLPSLILLLSSHPSSISFPLFYPSSKYPFILSQILPPIRHPFSDLLFSSSHSLTSNSLHLCLGFFLSPSNASFFHHPPLFYHFSLHPSLLVSFLSYLALFYLPLILAPPIFPPSYPSLSLPSSPTASYPSPSSIDPLPTYLQ